MRSFDEGLCADQVFQVSSKGSSCADDVGIINEYVHNNYLRIVTPKIGLYM